MSSLAKRLSNLEKHMGIQLSPETDPADPNTATDRAFALEDIVYVGVENLPQLIGLTSMLENLESKIGLVVGVNECDEKRPPISFPYIPESGVFHGNILFKEITSVSKLPFAYDCDLNNAVMAALKKMAFNWVLSNDEKKFVDKVLVYSIALKPRRMWFKREYPGVFNLAEVEGGD